MIHNGFMYYRLIKRSFVGQIYVNLLAETVMLIYKLNYSADYWFQYFNSITHTEEGLQRILQKQ